MLSSSHPTVHLAPVSLSHNIVFSSPSKSRIRVLQSIGRQLRKSEHKDVAKLYDIADDLSWKKYKNHTLRHFEDRLKIYDSEGFEHKVIKLNLKEDSHGKKLQSS